MFGIKNMDKKLLLNILKNVGFIQSPVCEDAVMVEAHENKYRFRESVSLDSANELIEQCGFSPKGLYDKKLMEAQLHLKDFKLRERKGLRVV